MRVAWEYGPLDHGQGGGTRKWGDKKEGHGDNKGENKGRGKKQRGGRYGGFRHEGKM
jgi:hypothetical protein